MMSLPSQTIGQLICHQDGECTTAAGHCIPTGPFQGLQGPEDTCYGCGLSGDSVYGSHPALHSETNQSCAVEGGRLDDIRLTCLSIDILKRSNSNAVVRSLLHYTLRYNLCTYMLVWDAMSFWRQTLSWT